MFRDRVVRELKRAFPKVEFNTPFDAAVPTTINFSVPGFSSKELLDLFDSAGVRLSAGSACSAASVEPSHVLDAMGVPEWRSVSALRLSFGPCTTEAEIDRGCRAIREAALALQSSCLINTVGGFEAPENLRDGVVQLRVGPTNSWIVADREARECVVIDPCETVAERIEGYVRCQGLKVMAVLDTHSHADHDSIRPLLQKVLSDCLADPTAQFDGLGWPASGTTEVTLADGTRAPALKLGRDRVLARVATPGHTDDSHALILMESGKAQFAFCGDTILSGGLGRTNFVVSDAEALFHSLRKLHSWLSGNTLLCPAHDYDNSFATTLDAEASANDLLRLAVGEVKDAPRDVLGLFVEKKREVDSRLASIEAKFQGIVCGVSGQGMAVDDRQLKSLEGVLGAKASYTMSTSWGILIPHVQIEALHEFEDDPDAIVSRFANDPTGTSIVISPDAVDTDYFNLGLGLSGVFANGRSAFLYYERRAGQRDFSQDSLAVGVRIEF